MAVAAALLPLIGDRVDVLHPLRTHDDDPRGGGDVDCVVDRLDPLWPLRLPPNARLLQCLHYDVTAWFWVLEVDGRVIKIDTLDDPEGIGTYGLPTRLWFAAGDDVNGLRAAYLTAKRLRKNVTASVSWEHVRAVAECGPQAFVATLEEMFGRSMGRQLGEVVLDGGKPSPEIWAAAERELLRRRLRDPLRAATFAFKTIARVGERVLRPTGLVVAVVGPDGSGKSTLARALPETCEGPFRRALHLHWRPGVLPSLGRLMGTPEGDVTRPHERPPHSPIVSLGRLLYYWVDFALGGWIRLAPMRVKSALVVVERGWWDVAVDPRRYRMRVPRRLVTALGRFVPRPDLALILEASPETLLGRKQEISEEEAYRQTAAWRTALPERIARVSVDASTSIEAVRMQARGVVFDRLEARTMSRLGAGWVALPSTRSRRWLLPRGPRAVTRAALSIYQPVTPAGLVGWGIAHVAATFGAFRLTPRAEPPQKAIRALLGRHLPPGASLATMRTNHPGRSVTAVVSSRGDLVAVAKMAVDDEGQEALAREGIALGSMAQQLPSPLRAPNVLEQEDGLLLLEACRWRPRARPWRLSEDAAKALGSWFRLTTDDDGHAGSSHGDLAPWNLLKGTEAWVLVDWEHAGSAPPFFDLFHYFVQSHALLGRPARHEIVVGVMDREGWIGRAIDAYAASAALPVEDAPRLLSTYLETSGATLDPDSPDGRAGISARRELLRLAERLGS